MNHCSLKIEHQRSFTLSHGEEFLSKVRLPDCSRPVAYVADPAGQGVLDAHDDDEESMSGPLSDTSSRTPRTTAAGPAMTAISTAGPDQYNGFGEEGNGLGRVRLGMVKMGCWVNVDAPQAVVQLIGAHRGRI